MLKVRPTYRILSLVLAAMIFISSVGVSVDLHFCSGELKSASFVGKAKSCHESAAQHCPHHQKNAENELTATKNCCSNKTVHFQSDSDKEFLKTALKEAQPMQGFVFSSFQYFYPNSQPLPESPVFYAYKPPPLLRDIPVLVQSFLI